MFTPEEITALKTKLSGPEGKEAIDTIVISIENMVISMNTMKTKVQLLEKISEDSQKLASDNEKACIDLTQTIKHIHIALNTYRDQVPPELVNLADELGKFVMSGAGIKAGIKDANNSK